MLSADTEDVKDDIKHHESPQDDLDLPLFDLATIIDATNNFSRKNKVGEGGFGPVYWVIISRLNYRLAS